MKKEEFIEVLKNRKYLYEIQGDKIIVTHNGSVDLENLKTLPPGVEFKNGGWVDLRSLETLPPGVEFKNRGFVYLSSLETLPPGVHFKNGGWVDLSSLETLPPGVEFNNGGNVWLSGLGWVDHNKRIRIEGVDNKRLLHLMIKKELLL